MYLFLGLLLGTISITAALFALYFEIKSTKE